MMGIVVETDAYFFQSAMRLLARREQSAWELMHKLQQKGASEVEASEVIVRCQQLNYQSDLRFTQMLVQSRAGKGYGPMRIKMELRQHQISQSNIADALAEIDWDAAIAVAMRKTAHADPLKQQQKMRQRGFVR